MKDALSGLKVRPKRRANGSPRTGETSADLLRSVPTSFPSGAPIKQPGWSDLESYDPQVLSAAAGRGITSALEGTAQMLGGARDYLGGFMQSVRERSPAELRGAAPARSKETYESVNRAVSQAAQDPLTTAKGLASAFVDVGIEAAKSPASMTEFIAGNITPGGRSRPAVSQVVKPKGGDFPKRLEAIESMKLFERDTEGMQLGANASTKEAAVNNWLGTKLDRYIRNEMATPEDPIRKLAEQGILHVDPEMINYDPGMYGRPFLGQPAPTLMAESGPARVWEGATDYMMGKSMRLGKLAKTDPSAPGLKRFMDENPWVHKVAQADPDRKIYIPSEDIGRDLGFDHLRDELLNSIDAESGLPQQLRLTNEQLGRMSVPDAVRHVSKINKWREKQKVEANFALANNAATVPFKDYPDQKYGWFQLTTDSPENRQVLQDALNYEADLMGHCVRGYCDDVLAGRSQIYSLRDKKTGAPHVTIEVKPGTPWNERSGLLYDNPELQDSWRQFLKVRNDPIDAGSAETGNRWSGYMLRYPQWLSKNQPDLYKKYEQVFQPDPPEIVQIKGKANLKPKDEYIPFVQDFVKSQQWGIVRDFKNTNLVDLTHRQSVGKWIEDKMADHVARQVIEDMQNEGLRFVGLDELNARHSALVKERVAARKAAEPPEAKASRQQLRELRRAERRRERGE